MPDIGGRDQHSLLARQPARSADIEEALDLFVDPADGLDLPILADRAGHCQRLLTGRPEMADNRAYNSADEALSPFDAPIGLFENQTGRQRERAFGRIARAQETGQDQHALRMDRSAQFDLAFDVNHFAIAQSHARRDAAGLAKCEIARLKHG